MKTKLKFTALNIGLFIALLLLINGCESSNRQLPSDQELETEFQQHKSQFIWLANEVIKQRYYRVRLEDGEVTVNPGTLDKAQRETYKAILQEVSVDLINAYRDKSSFEKISDVAFFRYREGYVFGGQSKGIAFVLDANKLTVKQSLDQYASDIKKSAVSERSDSRVYKKIEDSWYLFYDYFD